MQTPSSNGDTLDSVSQGVSKSPSPSELGAPTNPDQERRSTPRDCQQPDTTQQPNNEPRGTEQPYTTPPWIYRWVANALEKEFKAQNRVTGVSQIESNVRGTVPPPRWRRHHRLITCAKIVVAGSHWQSTAKPSRRSSNACNRTGDGGCPVDSLPGGDVAGPNDTSSSGRGSISSPSLGQQCPVHRPRSSFGWRANDDFARCLEECPLFDPDSTEPDWDRSQIEFEETDSDDDGAGVRAGAAMVLLGFRGPNGDQVPPQHMDTGDEDAEA